MKSNTPFKEYLKVYYTSVASGCRDLANRVNKYQMEKVVTSEHIRQIAYGKAQPSIKLCNWLIQAAPGTLSYKELRPDVYEDVMGTIKKRTTI